MLNYRYLAKFLADNIEDYEPRVQIALNRIDHNRCSLQQADYQLYSEMVDLVDEWAIDNDCQDEVEDIDIETLMFNF